LKLKGMVLKSGGKQASFKKMPSKTDLANDNAEELLDKRCKEKSDKYCA